MFKLNSEKSLALKITFLMFLLLSFLFLVLISGVYKSALNNEMHQFDKGINSFQKDMSRGAFGDADIDITTRTTLVKKIHSRLIRNILFIPYESFDTTSKGIFEYANFKESDFLNLQKGVIYKKVFDGYHVLIYRFDLGKGALFLAHDISPLHDFYHRFLIVSFGVLSLLLIILYYVSLRLARITLKPIYETNRRLKEYNHNIAHELKTPLSIMKSNLELLDMGYSTELVESGKEEVILMESIVDSLLFLSENIQVTSKQRVILHKEVKKIIEVNMLTDRKVKIINTISTKGKKLELCYDEKLFGRLMKNVLENAFKYSPEGSKVLIHLENTGIKVSNTMSQAIPKDELPKLFDTFYQADSSRSTDGYGLGLSIIKKICDTLGWSVSLDLKGDTFIVDIRSN